MSIIRDNSTVEETDGGYLHKTDLLVNEGPILNQVEEVRKLNDLGSLGFSDQRTMRFRAQIPEWRVWEAENVLGFDLTNKNDFRRYLMLHPEFIVAPDTGRSGKIIIR